MMKNKVFSYVLITIAIVSMTKGPLSAATEDKIFGISFGAGGISKCDIATVRFKNQVGGYTTRKRWNYPQGWDEATGGRPVPEARSREVPYTCFVPLHYDGGPTVDPNRSAGVSSVSNQFEPVLVIWPTAQAPKLPGLLSRTKVSRLAKSGFSINGALEILRVPTAGLAVQDQIIGTLSDRFGTPKSMTTVNIVSSNGKKETSKNAVWVTDEFYITLEGITEDQCTEKELFGVGAIWFRTYKGQELFERGRRVENQNNL